MEGRFLLWSQIRDDSIRRLGDGASAESTGMKVERTVRIAKNEVVLEEGIGFSRDAAQVAVQRAFEKRLNRAGLKRYMPEEYEWK